MINLNFSVSARRALSRLVIVACFFAFGLGVASGPVLADKTGTDTAMAAVKALPPKALIRLNLLLTALNLYKDKVVTVGLNTVKGIIKFQRAKGLPATGKPDQRTLAALEAEGAPILDYFNLQQFKHPRTGALLGIPVGLVAESRQTSRGLLFEGLNDEISIDFSFVPRNRAGFDDLFDRWTGDATGRRVHYENIEDNFFVVTGTENRQVFAAMYYAVDEGSIGFNLRFDPVRVRYGDRLAFLIGATFDPFPPKGRTAERPGSPPADGRQQRPPSGARALQTGSGFFVTASGVGITNHHVIKGCLSTEITGYGPVEIVAFDQINDLAILRLKKKAKTQAIPIRRTQPQLGEKIFAMGFPLAGALDNGLNFTSGVVSSLAGAGNDTRVIQFTAPIQPGNSGGPLVDATGVLIGVVQAKLNDLAALKAIGTIPQNVNFAIKADMLLGFLNTHQIQATIAEDSRPELSTAKIADGGRKSAFQVRCEVSAGAQANEARKQ